MTFARSSGVSSMNTRGQNAARAVVERNEPVMPSGSSPFQFGPTTA